MPPVVQVVKDVVSSAINIASSAFSSAFNFLFSWMIPKTPDLGSAIAGRTQIIRNATAPHRIVYGQCCISGPLIAAFSYGDSNKYVYLIIALTSHEVEEIGDVYIGDVLSTDSKFTKSDGTSLVQITKYLGSAGQTADADLIANAVDKAGNHVWTSNHTLSGRSYLVVRLEYDQTAFASGLPNVKAVVKGVNDVYDPRTGLTGWTDNAVLCVRDYLVKTYGIGAASGDINDTNFIAAANICDEMVSVRVGSGSGYTTDGSYYATGRTGINLISGTGTILAGDTITITIPDCYYTIDGVYTHFPASAHSYVVENGLSSGYLVLSGSGLVADIPPAACAVLVQGTNSEKRYTCNGSFTLDQKPADIMKKMLTACVGRLVWSQGQYSIFPAAYNYPVGTLTESDLRDDISILPAPSRQQRFNTVRGTFVSPAQYWQQVDFPYQQNATQYAADQSFEICQTLELPYTISASTAQRLAAIYLNQNIRGISVTFPAKLTAFKYQPGDVLYLTIVQLGWSSKEFRVMDWKLSDSGGVDLTLREEDSTIYGWTLSDEKVFIPPASAKVTPYIPSVPDVTNFSASQNGAFVIFSWDNIEIDGNIAGYEIRYNPKGDYVWADGTPITQVEKGTHFVSLRVGPGAWTFLICSLDVLNNYSTNPATYDLTVINVNTIVSGGISEAAKGWPGALTNMVKHWTGKLVSQSQGVASGDGWDTFNKFCPNPYVTSSYEAPEMMLPADISARAHGEITSVSSPIPLGMAAPGLFIKWHKAADPYNSYTAWGVGDVLAKYVTMKFVVDTSIGIPVVTDFSPTLDATARTESAANVATLNTGTIITFITPFVYIPVVQVTPIGNAGLFAVISNLTVNGFTITIYNASGTAIAGLVNWQAQGV